MQLDFLGGQAAVLAVTTITFLLSVILALVLTRKYISRKQPQYLYWSLGLWFFAIGVFLEVLFAYGIYSELLIDAYLLVVVVLVELLAIGSMELVKKRSWRQAYFAFSILATIFATYTLATSYVGNVIVNYIVYGNLPIMVVVSSSIATFAAALVLVGVAAKSYMATRNRKMLFIIAGVVIVSIAGTLYIVQFPAFLYIAEFVGILLLWLGLL